MPASEDVSARYRSYGWEVFDVAAKADGDVDRENLEKVMLKSLEIKNKPVLIRLSTVIAWPAPTARGTAKSHGSALGVEEVAATKQQLGMDPTQSFVVSNEVIQHAREIQQRGAAMHKNWLEKFESWQKSNTVQSALLNRLINNGLPEDWEKNIPVFSSDKEIATRAASGKVLILSGAWFILEFVSMQWVQY